MSKFNTVFASLNNQIELQQLAKRRVAACRSVSAEGRTKLATAKERHEKVALGHQVANAENHARKWQPFVHVLPDFGA